MWGKREIAEWCWGEKREGNCSQDDNNDDKSLI